ncbi:hypothetical protein V5E97_15975 [Singulisphaera sp. Ch08]|uniref:Twin-arginine translocation signal domain-containing protein n=1 Tax=Singulisphaera sp. Ch08 TaxID=3120278 RepID=A0AAU7CPY6_9BACT
MPRREFIKESRAGLVATTLNSPFVHASDKVGVKNSAVGAGDHRNE